MTSKGRTIGRVALGAGLIFAGVSHLTFARKDFRAQVPDFVPLPVDTTVIASGVVEMALGSALLLVRKRRQALGSLVGAFFVAVFPGNVAQWVHRRKGFGLDTDSRRFGRLFFQLPLVMLAVWSTRKDGGSAQTP